MTEQQIEFYKRLISDSETIVEYEKASVDIAMELSLYRDALHHANRMRIHALRSQRLQLQLFLNNHFPTEP